MSRDKSTGFPLMDIGGSRHRDVALFVCAAGVCIVLVMRPGALLLAAAGIALGLVALRLHRVGCVRRLGSTDGDALECGFVDGSGVSGRPVAARLGRHWLSVSIRPERGRTVSLLLFGDQFANADEDRRFRLWLRARLPDDECGADAGWSAWRRRLFPDSHD